MTYLNNIATRFSDSPSVDAFARARVANPFSVFDIKHLFDKQTLFFDESITNNSGNATSTHSAVDANVTMHVEANDTIIRQTKMRFNYEPGKGQLFVFTGTLGAATTNLISRIGACDGTDGLYFEQSSSGLKVAIRKNSSNKEILQNDWNEDKLDGTGPSGITVDPTKMQIFVIDYQWLGIGRVRFGIEIDGQIIYCHKENHSNSQTSVYMSHPNLPIRYEIISSGGTGDLVQVCSTVISEGGYDPTGVLRTHSTGSTHVDASTANQIYPILGIRLKSTHSQASTQLSAMSAISETADDFRWIISMNPTITGTFAYTNLDSTSATQIATGTSANQVTNLGTVFLEGYASTGAVGNSQTARESQLKNVLSLGTAIDGTRDEIVLSVMPLGADSDIQAALTWREIY